MNGTYPSAPDSAAEVAQLRADVNRDVTMTDHLGEELLRQVVAIEEVLAAPWPRRLFARRRLVRDLRRSVSGYSWVGPDFWGRRAQALGDGWLDRNRPSTAPDSGGRRG